MPRPANGIDVAILGGGISGLVAAYRFKVLDPSLRVRVFDPAPGGKLATAWLGGDQLGGEDPIALDVGAEAFLLRRPEAVSLITELGLAEHIITPTAMRPALLVDSILRPLPAGTLMGIDPATPESAGPLRWSAGADRSIGELVGERFGAAAVSNGIDPLLSGVYAARAQEISVRAAIPALAAELDRAVAADPSAATLGGAVAAVLARTATSAAAGPVFGALRGGYRELLGALSAHVNVGPDRVTLVRPTAGAAVGEQWLVSTESGEAVAARAVISALPAPALAVVLGEDRPEAATLRQIGYASTALLSVLAPPGTVLPQHSGVLVGSNEPFTVKAITLTANKWAERAIADGSIPLRISLGRFGQRLPDDGELVSLALAEAEQILGTNIGVTAADTGRWHLQHWTEGMPVYRPGHLDLVAALDARQGTDGLWLTGAYLDGVGVAATIGRADRTARAVAAALGSHG